MVDAFTEVSEARTSRLMNRTLSAAGSVRPIICKLARPPINVVGFNMSWP